MSKTRQLALGAILGAIAVVIPVAFGFLRVYIPPFSATLASHVPVMLAVFGGPLVALAAGLGSTLGFFLILPLVITARASIHIIWGVVGAFLYLRGMKPWAVLLVVLPLHAIGEALVVVPFGWSLSQAGLVVGVGTALHHLFDMGLTLIIMGILLKVGVRLGRAS